MNLGYRVMRNEHVQAQGIVDTVADPLLVLDRDLCVETASRAFYDTFKVGRDETIGQHLYELGDGQWDIPELRRLLEDVIPKSSAVLDYEVEHDFPGLGRRTMLLSARRLFHPDYISRTLLLSMVDATERHKREAEKDLLMGELRHRIKNLLAMVQAMALQTSAKGRSGEEYRDAFLGRFNALVRPMPRASRTSMACSAGPHARCSSRAKCFSVPASPATGRPDRASPATDDPVGDAAAEPQRDHDKLQCHSARNRVRRDRTARRLPLPAPPPWRRNGSWPRRRYRAHPSV
jgi:hypothetical protein